MDKPRGMLMTGAIGSIFMAVAWGIFVTMIAAILSFVFSGGGNPSEGDANLMGGMGLLALVMLLAGGIMQGVGFLGLRKMFGGLFSLAGLFTIFVSVGLVIAVVGAVAQILSAAQVGAYVLSIAMVLGALVGGLGFFAARGQAKAGGGPLVFGGATLAIGAVAVIALVVLGLLKVTLPGSVVQILAYVGVGGMLLGHLGATVVMFGQRA